MIDIQISRKIIHVDMDAFFASVEQRDNPELRGKPIAIGSSGRRGVLSTASYEAREFGVGSAMPGFIAKQKCPQLIFVSGRMEVYIEISKQIMEIFYRHTDFVEQVSVDEAFLDVSKSDLPASEIAETIRKQIKDELNLTASAGVSTNKFLAKIASDYKKPNGLTIIRPEIIDSFTANLAVKRFFGVGKVTLKKMESFGIIKGSDIRKKGLEWMAENFGKQGSVFYELSFGVDERELETKRTRKSIGAEKTFLNDISNIEKMKKELAWVVNKVVHQLILKKKYGFTLTLKVKFSDFKQITRSKTVDYRLNNPKNLTKLMQVLLTKVDFNGKKVRLLGLQVSKLEDM